MLAALIALLGGCQPTGSDAVQGPTTTAPSGDPTDSGVASAGETSNQQKVPLPSAENPTNQPPAPRIALAAIAGEHCDANGMRWTLDATGLATIWSPTLRRDGIYAIGATNNLVIRWTSEQVADDPGHLIDIIESHALAINDEGLITLDGSELFACPSLGAGALMHSWALDGQVLTLEINGIAIVEAEGFDDRGGVWFDLDETHAHIVWADGTTDEIAADPATSTVMAGFFDGAQIVEGT